MKALNSDKIFDFVNYFVLAIVGIFMLYPFYYILIYSISNPQEAAAGLTFFPKGFTLLNYITIFTKNDTVMRGFAVSISRTLLGTALSVICSAMMAYGLSKSILPGRKLMYRMLVITMYLNAGIIPIYLNMNRLHLDNNFMVYILPHIINAFNIILLKTYFEQLPEALEESALVDGAGYFKIFTQIIWPLSMPILATITIFKAVEHWNSWYDNFLFITNPKLHTLQLVLYNFLREAQGSATAPTSAETEITVTPASIRMTITMVAIIPIFIVYPFMQNYFIKGIMLGAVKE